MDALKDFPSTNKKLKTANGIANHFKTDIFKGLLWYFNPEDGGIISLDKDAVKEILTMNEKGEFPESLKDYSIDLEANTKKVDYENVVGQDDLTRFDSKIKKKPFKNRNKNKKSNGEGGKVPQNKSQAKSQQKGKEGAKNKPKNVGGNKSKPQSKQSGENKKAEGNKGPKKRPQKRKPKPQNKENKGDKE